MQRRKSVLSALISVAAIALLLDCPQPQSPDPPPAGTTFFSFKLDGVPFYYEAGPTGSAAAASGGTIDFEGIPASFKRSADTRTVALLVASTYDVTFGDGPGEAVLDFSGFAVGVYDTALFFYDGLLSTDIQLEITSYEAVGGVVTGVFSGTLSGSALTEGIFSARLYPEVSTGS